VACGIPTATPEINQHSLLDRLSPPPHKKKNLNNKQGTEKEHAAEGVGCSKCTREGGRSKELISTGTFSKQRLKKQKGQQWVGDKLLPEIGQIWSTKFIS
jgi:hypothetical protein